MRRTKKEIQAEREEAGVMGITINDLRRLKIVHPDIKTFPLIQRNKFCEIAICSPTSGCRILQELISDGLRVFKTQAEGRCHTYFYEHEVMEYLNRYKERRQQEIKLKQEESARRQTERNKIRYAKFKEYLKNKANKE